MKRIPRVFGLLLVAALGLSSCNPIEGGKLLKGFTEDSVQSTAHEICVDAIKSPKAEAESWVNLGILEDNEQLITQIKCEIVIRQAARPDGFTVDGKKEARLVLEALGLEKGPNSDTMKVRLAAAVSEHAGGLVPCIPLESLPPSGRNLECR